jgi:hypothetical protein
VPARTPTSLCSKALFSIGNSFIILGPKDPPISEPKKKAPTVAQRHEMLEDNQEQYAREVETRFQLAHGIPACKAKMTRDKDVMKPRVTAVPMTKCERRGAFDFSVFGLVLELVRAAPA